ncbi:MAG: M15 family metallopeptidase, partial [bacterium]
EGAIAPEPPGGLGNPFPADLERTVRQLVAIAQQSHNPLLIAFVTRLVDTLWQAKLDFDRAAARAAATDHVRFDHVAGLGWQLVGPEWTGARVDRMLEGLARVEAVYGQARIDVRAAPWTLFHDHGLPDEAKGEVLAYDLDFMGLPRHIQRVRIELDGRGLAISDEQQVELAIHAVHHAAIAPTQAPSAASSPALAAAFVPAPGTFGESWVGTIWPTGQAVEAGLAVSQFALLGAGEDLADSGTAFVERELGHVPAALLALLGERLRIFQQMATSCACTLDSGELLRVGESFCNFGTQTLACERINGQCAVRATARACSPAFEEQSFCPVSADVQYGSDGQLICDPIAGGWQALQCSGRVWQPQGGFCNGCLPSQTCRPVVGDPDRPTLRWVNRRRCLLPCGYTLPDPVALFPGSQQLRRATAEAYWAMRAAYRASQHNAGLAVPVVSATRDFATQIDTFIRQRNGADCVYGMAYSALPGHSEHQTGDALDIGAWDINFTVTTPLDATLAAFIEQNACKWGFVRSYPASSMHITGYTPELWHWRYVGVHRALFLRPLQPSGSCAQQGPTIEEYLAEHPDEAETSDCGQTPSLGQCPSVTPTSATDCIATVPPLPVPPSALAQSSPGAAACPACSTFVPPASSAQITVVACTGPEPTITVAPNSMSIYQTAIHAGDA